MATEKCEHCNSVHSPDDYQEGWFVCGNETDGYRIEHVKGEAEILAVIGEPPDGEKYAFGEKVTTVYWSEAGALDAKARLEGSWLAHPITGTLLTDPDGNHVRQILSGKITFDHESGVILSMEPNVAEVAVATDKPKPGA